MNELKPEDVYRWLDEIANNENLKQCSGIPSTAEAALALLRENKATLEMCAEVIQRQDKELARKDALLAEWDAKCNDYETALMGKVAEIERLKAHNKELDNLCDILHKKIDEGYAEFANEERAEAVTEFAERFKASLNDVARWQMHGVDGEYFIIGKSLVDQIAKEMKEGSKDA